MSVLQIFEMLKIQLNSCSMYMLFSIEENLMFPSFKYLDVTL